MTRFPGHGGSSVARLVRLTELLTAYGPTAFILTLPLEFTSVSLRQQLSRFVLAVVIVAFLYSVITRWRTISLPGSISLVLLALYVAASLASWAVTRAPGSSNSVLDVALYPVVALVLANIVATESDHRRAWNAFLVSALAIALEVGQPDVVDLVAGAPQDLGLGARHSGDVVDERNPRHAPRTRES